MAVERPASVPVHSRRRYRERRSPRTPYDLPSSSWGPLQLVRLHIALAAEREQRQVVGKMYTSRLRIVAFALVVLAAPLSAQRSLCDAAPAGALLPSRDLYCLVLVASPDIAGVAGQVELGRAPGPFTIDVTAAGRTRYAPTLTISGLPAPATLGHYMTYVAWLATPVMYPIVRLGA